MTSSQVSKGEISDAVLNAVAGQELRQGNLAVPRVRAMISTQDGKHVTLSAQGHVLLMCFYQLPQAAADCYCVPGLPGMPFGHRLLFLLQHPPGFLGRPVRKRCPRGWLKSHEPAAAFSVQLPKWE